MGQEFSKIPVDVIKHHILAWIPDYLDRLNFAKTCKTFWSRMQEIDSVTKAIIHPDHTYGNALKEVASLNHYHSFERIHLNISYAPCRYLLCVSKECDPLFHIHVQVLIECVYVTSCTMIIKRLKKDLGKHFGLVFALHICKTFGMIPKKYEDLIVSPLDICCGAAKIGNYNLFMSYFKDDLLINYHEPALALCAVDGGNYDICKKIVQFPEHELKIYRQLIFQENTTLLVKLAENDEKLYEICLKLSDRYKDNGYIEFYNDNPNFYIKRRKI
jgi:hypothetical protein